LRQSFLQLLTQAKNTHVAYLGVLTKVGLLLE
jgi:hypothetical protein